MIGPPDVMQQWIAMAFRPPPTLDEMYGPGASGMLFQQAMSPPTMGLPDANLAVFYDVTQAPGQKTPPPPVAATGPRPGQAPPPDPSQSTMGATPQPPSRGYHTLTAAWANRQARQPGIEQA